MTRKRASNTDSSAPFDPEELSSTNRAGSPDDVDSRAGVLVELERAAEHVRSFSVDDFRSGDWFMRLIVLLVRTYDRNARAAYFQEKYRGLPAGDIADKLVSVAVRNAAITGGVTGAAVTADELLAFASGGVSLALIVGAIGTEIVCLGTIQMRLVLDLATIYGQELDPDDPEDVLTVFQYALGAAPTEAMGRVVKGATRHGTKTAIKKVISKGTLQTVQEVGRLLGFRILQRTIIKYSVPIASAAVGSSYNYITTKSLGKIAKAHMRNRGRAAAELRGLSTTAAMMGVALPAAMMAMAQADGGLKESEKDLYVAMTSKIAKSDWDSAEFERLMSDGTALLDALAEVEAPDVRQSIVEALALMAAYDGDLSAAETEFLTLVAARLEVDIDMAAVASQVDQYRSGSRGGIVADDGDSALEHARDAAVRAVRSVPGAAVATAKAVRRRVKRGPERKV